MKWLTYKGVNDYLQTLKKRELEYWKRERRVSRKGKSKGGGKIVCLTDCYTVQRFTGASSLVIAIQCYSSVIR